MNIWMILVLVVKCCFKFLCIIFLCWVESLGNWCKVFFVVVEEILEFEYGLLLNVIEFGDKVEFLFVLLLELFDILVEIDKFRGCL